jgi:hypothetical protein
MTELRNWESEKLFLSAKCANFRQQATSGTHSLTNALQTLMERKLAYDRMDSVLSQISVLSEVRVLASCPTLKVPNTYPPCF